MDPSPWLQTAGPAPQGKVMGLALADFDGDGAMDVAAAGVGPALAVYFGDGAGGYQKALSLPVRGEVRAVAAGDLDGDRLPDLAFSIQGEGSLGVQVWLSDARGGFTQGVAPVKSGQYEGVCLADVNSDGRLDLCAADNTSETEGGVRVWLSDGKGGWLKETGPVNINRFMDVAAADFNGDGNVDLAAAGTGAYGALRVWLGDGRGGWSPTAALERGSYFRLTVFDANWDGNPDILAGTYRTGPAVFYGDGKGGFVRRFRPQEKGSFWKPLITSLSGERTPVMVASSVDSDGIAAWELSTKGFWEKKDLGLPDEGVFYDLARADMDGDGLCDLLAASFGQGVKVWLAGGGSPGPAPASAAASVSGPCPCENGTVAAAAPPPRGPAPAPPPSGEEEAASEPEKNEAFATVAGFPEYRIGPDDLLVITLWKGAEATEHEVRVRPEGRISFGFVQDMFVNGMTPSQLDAALTAEFARFVREPMLDVSVKEHRSKKVTFMGAVKVLSHRDSGPGVYPLSGKTTLYEMLSRVGGPAPDADVKRVSVRRANGEQRVVDLYKFIMQGDKSQNIVLDAGDYVFVPRISESDRRVFVVGEVRRPGVYQIGNSANVLEAVLMAGGFSPLAEPAAIKIIRGGLERPQVLSADMSALLAQNDLSQNLAVESGDIVCVPRGFIGDVHAFLQNINPLMNAILYPGRFRDEYMYDDALRINVGGTRTSDRVNVNVLPAP
ncbi:MAG: VCBS repeat-containing protein [Deltaproteobacteria bacterium]|nr:VCBS repeat-containing protein [Deltaproteobacteria bacterium]